MPALMTPAGRALLMGNAPFTPLSIAGLKLWLDASRITGLVDADPVPTWTDLSGNGNTVTQATAAKKPTYRTAIQNGLPVVRFDGVDDYLQSAALGADLAQPTTILIVAKNTTVDTTQRHMIDGIGATKRQAILRRNSSGTKFAFFAGTIVNGGADSTAAAIFTAVFNGASSTLAVNGVLAVTGDVGAQPLDGFTIGGNNAGSGNFWTGDHGEVLVYGGALTAGQRLQIETYLRAKWGTP